MKPGQRLERKVAIVTGGASGIGEATVRLFAGQGATVIIADRDAEKGHQVEQEVMQQGGEAHAIKTDVTSLGDCKRLIEERMCRVIAKK